MRSTTKHQLMSARLRMAALLPFVFLFSTQWLSGQREPCPAIHLEGVSLDPITGSLQFNILARDSDCAVIESLAPNDIRVIESIALSDTQAVSISNIVFDPVYDTVNLKADTVQLLFLLDRSEAVTERDVVKQVELINQFLNQYEDQLGDNASFYSSTFGGDPGPFVGGESNRFLNGLMNAEMQGGQPDLYRALITSFNQLGELPGRKFVFVFSNGVHVPNPERYPADGPRIPPLLDEVLEPIYADNDEMYVFPITTDLTDAEGDRVLEALVGATDYIDDVVSGGFLPRELDWAFSNQYRMLSSHRASAVSNRPTFKGELREYCLYEDDRVAPDCELFRAGSWSNPAGPVLRAEGAGYLGYGLFGGLLIALALGIFAVLFPQIRQWRFQREHVVAYAPVPGRTLFDPATREPITPGEPVVNVCRMPIPLATWRECDNQCPHFPECTKNNLQCKGEGVQREQPFFRPTGSNRRLNWIWFGALGGFVGWLLFAVADWGTRRGWGGLGRYADRLMEQVTEGASATTLVEDGLIGACFGTGLILLLSIMEERTQSDKFKYGRIALRTLVGALLSLCVFGLGFLLQATGLIAYPLLVAVLTWTLFGLCLGVVLTVNSSITVARGVVGGLLAGLAGFTIYWLISGLSDDYLLAKLISLILAGGVLGLVLDTVINLAEDYYIEFLQPVEYSRNRVPLSKWLKSDYEIIIGTQPGSQVYIKWPDEAVEPEHARITLENDGVYLLPYGETLVNNQIIGQKRIRLRNDDIIRLGRRSLTEMRYAETTESTEE